MFHCWLPLCNQQQQQQQQNKQAGEDSNNYEFKELGDGILSCDCGSQIKIKIFSKIASMI